MNRNSLKTPTGRRQTSWLFTKHAGVEFRATEDKSIQWQGGGLEPGTSGLQVQRPNHQATPRLHPLNQSDLKPKPVAPASHAFSRALSGLLTFTYNYHFLVVLFSFLLIGCLVLRHSIEMRSKVTEFAVLSRLCLKCMSTLVTSLQDNVLIS